MPRANSSVPRHRRHRKVVKQAKGYYGARSRNFKAAKDAVEKAGLYAYRDRRQKKRQFRRLWIIRINAAARQNGLSYSQFIAKMKAKEVDLDRKVLADLAMNEPEALKELVNLLNSYDVQFADVNVLEDPEIRIKLSEHSNWPTIPQLFVSGQLIGGCDIAMELHNNGQLKEILDNAK